MKPNYLIQFEGRPVRSGVYFRAGRGFGQFAYYDKKKNTWGKGQQNVKAAYNCRNDFSAYQSSTFLLCFGVVFAKRNKFHPKLDATSIFLNNKIHILRIFDARPRRYI